jgi:uncharacterized RDD family membrane protein YckC
MKKFLAFVIDFILAFGVIGYLFASLFGMTEEGGFNITGVPAIIFTVWIVFYFWGMGKLGKKTVGKLVMKI